LGHCVLCRDEAVAGRVLSIDASTATAQVEIEGTVATVALDLVETASPGDTVLVHQGFAIHRVER
jgi:hydrogenase maturation factor